MEEIWRNFCLATDFLVAPLRSRPEAFKEAEDCDSTKAEISTTPMNAFETYLVVFRSREAEGNVRQADDLPNLGSRVKLRDVREDPAKILSELITEERPLI